MDSIIIPVHELTEYTETENLDTIYNIADGVKVRYRYFSKDFIVKETFSQELQFENCKFYGTVDFQNVALKAVSFKDCSFYKQCIFSKGCKFQGELKITGTSYLNDLAFGDKAELKETVLEGRLDITDLRLGPMVMSAFHVRQGESYTPKIHHFHAWLTDIVGHVWLRDISIQVLNLTGIMDARSSMRVESIKVRKINIYRFKNRGLLSFSSLQVISDNNDSMFDIDLSDLGDTQFSECSFEAFSKMHITNSNLMSCHFINTSFPDKMHTRTFEEQKKKINGFYIFKILAEKLPKEKTQMIALKADSATYRQLKLALEKQGDSINAQKFHLQEMEAYRVALKLEKKDWWNRQVLRLSYYTSEYGQSIKRPFWCLVIIGGLLVFFATWAGSFSDLQVNFSHPTTSGLRLGVNYYFRLINPLHRSEELFPGYTIIYDVILRIFSSYMIYNIIRASRRFIK